MSVAMEKKDNNLSNNKKNKKNVSVPHKNSGAAILSGIQPGFNVREGSAHGCETPSPVVGGWISNGDACRWSR